MFSIPSLAKRHRQDELMDQPGLAEDVHQQALRGLARINTFSGSGRILWPDLQELARQIAPRPLRVLDVATGGGDLPRWLLQRSRKAGLTFDISAMDFSPTAIEFAKTQGMGGIRYIVGDVLKDPFPDEYDVVLCSLFLHHLDEEQVVPLLAKMAGSARHFILANDLERTALGYGLAWVGTRILSRSPVVHIDGPLSVQGAWSCAEITQLAKQAGLEKIRVRRRWPCRFLLRGRKSS